MAYKDIVFINGTVKSKEKDLIGHDKFIRMTEAADADEAFALLKGYGFGKSAPADTRKEDYEKLIRAEWNGFYAFLKDYAPDGGFLAAALARNDFFNAECAVRQKNLALSDDLYLPEGIYSVKTLKDAADGKITLPAHLFEPMREAQGYFDEGTATGAKISTVFLRSYFGYMSKTVKNRDWRRIISYEADAKNLSAAFRAGDKARFDEGYLPGGELDKKTLYLIVEGDEVKAREKTKQTPCFSLVKAGFEAVKEGKPLVFFEREAEDFPMKMLKEKRFETEGVIPMLLYVYYKINEIKNVRLVMSMKLCGADKEIIKGRLKECYAG